MGTCCNWCCLITGGFGAIMLGLLACAFYFGAYFEPEIDLEFEANATKIAEKREARAIGLMFGVIVEFTVFIICLGVLLTKRRNRRVY